MHISWQKIHTFGEEKLNVIIAKKDGTPIQDIQNILKKNQKKHRHATPFSYVLREGDINFRIDLYLSNVEMTTSGKAFTTTDQSFEKLDEIAQQIVTELEALQPPGFNSFPLQSTAATAPPLPV